MFFLKNKALLSKKFEVDLWILVFFVLFSLFSLSSAYGSACSDCLGDNCGTCWADQNGCQNDAGCFQCGEIWVVVVSCPDGSGGGSGNPPSCQLSCSGCTYANYSTCSCSALTCTAPWVLNSGACSCDCGLTCSVPFVLNPDNDCTCICDHAGFDYQRYLFDDAHGFTTTWRDTNCCQGTWLQGSGGDWGCSCPEGVDYRIDLEDDKGSMWNEPDDKCGFPLMSGSLLKMSSWLVIKSWEPYQGGGLAKPLVTCQLYAETIDEDCVTYQGDLIGDLQYYSGSEGEGNWFQYDMKALKKGYYIVECDDIPTSCSSNSLQEWSTDFYYSGCGCGSLDADAISAILDKVDAVFPFNLVPWAHDTVAQMQNIQPMPLEVEFPFFGSVYLSGFDLGWIRDLLLISFCIGLLSIVIRKIL